MVPAYYAILQDIGYFIRHRKRRKADILRAIDEAFDQEEIKEFFVRQPEKGRNGHSREKEKEIYEKKVRSLYK